MGTYTVKMYTQKPFIRRQFQLITIAIILNKFSASVKRKVKFPFLFDGAAFEHPHGTAGNKLLVL